jgi:hypothetical protein
MLTTKPYYETHAGELTARKYVVVRMNYDICRRVPYHIGRTAHAIEVSDMPDECTAMLRIG